MIGFKSLVLGPSLRSLAGGCSHTLTARARPVPGSRAPRELSLSRGWSADDATKCKRLQNIQPSLEPKGALYWSSKWVGISFMSPPGPATAVCADGGREAVAGRGWSSSQSHRPLAVRHPVTRSPSPPQQAIIGAALQPAAS